MDFYLSKHVTGASFELIEAKVTKQLIEHGFGIVTQIDMQSTFKNKLGVDFRPYKILGACNAKFAHAALSQADKIGVMLPCNVCIQQLGDLDFEVFTVNPLEAMVSVNNSAITKMADEIYGKLKLVLDSL